MKSILNIVIWVVLTVSCSALRNNQVDKSLQNSKLENCSLGAFSISLNVNDLALSRDFYEKLGFKKFGGDEKQNYLILKNGPSLIGIFNKMFDGNILTFNPGWDQDAKTVQNFIDVREIQTNLKSKGLKIDLEIIENTNGPASIMLKDPDGNQILLDQHI